MTLAMREKEGRLPWDEEELAWVAVFERPRGLGEGDMKEGAVPDWYAYASRTCWAWQVRGHIFHNFCFRGLYAPGWARARQAGKTRPGKVTVPGVVTLEDGRGDSRDEATSDADERMR